jgi:hypothetical protein
MGPPQFKDLGKKAKDLFKKQYDFKNEVKVFNKGADSIKIESGGYQGKALAGYTKANWTDKSLGAFEVELHSTGSDRAKLVCNKFGNVGVSVEGSTSGALTLDASTNANVAGAAVALAAVVKHNYNKGSTAINASAVFGDNNGVSVGANCDIDASNLTSPTDYNVGCEFTQKDLTATLVTSNQGNDIHCSYFQNVCSSLVLGSSLVVKPDSGSRLFTFGGEYNMDKATTLKFKTDSNGIVGTALTHTLADPSCKVQASAQFDSLSADIFAPQKFGLSLSFGDF